MSDNISYSDLLAESPHREDPRTRLHECFWIIDETTVAIFSDTPATLAPKRIWAEEYKY